jgi:hypothetical protein
MSVFNGEWSTSIAGLGFVQLSTSLKLTVFIDASFAKRQFTFPNRLRHMPNWRLQKSKYHPLVIHQVQEGIQGRLGFGVVCYGAWIEIE